MSVVAIYMPALAVHLLIPSFPMRYSKQFVPSPYVNATKTVKFEDDPRLCPNGPKGPVSAEHRAIFLQECNQAFLDRKLSVKCSDVRCGSVLVDLEGVKADVATAVKEIEQKGLQLPTFSKLTVVVPEGAGGNKKASADQTGSDKKSGDSKASGDSKTSGKTGAGKSGAVTTAPKGSDKTTKKTDYEYYEEP